MTSNSTDSSSSIYRWIERKPLSEAVSWTYREKFWLITATCHYGTHNWKSVAQVVRNAGEPYRPKEWYTSKSCERQFKIIISNLSKESKLKPLNDVLQHIAEDFKKEYLREAFKAKDTLKTKYSNLFSILNRVKQGNLSRNEVVNLYSVARRNEVEGKHYMDQLMTRQTTWLASENSRYGLSEEPIKWNTPSAPLLTSLLRSRNTIPANRTATTIASLLQPTGGTSRTRSGKLLSLSPNVRTQGTPTLSKLLEAPANPYIPSPLHVSQKNKISDIVGTDKLVGNTSRKENSQSTSLNRVRVDNISTSSNQINKIDLSASRRQSPRSPVTTVKNGSKANSNVVNLLSDSDNDEIDKSLIQSLHPKNLFDEKKNNINITASNSNRIETRATRSQTRAEGGFKHLNDNKLTGGKKERETLQQHSGESQITNTPSIDDELIDIDQIEIEPLSSVQDETISHTPSKITRSTTQRLRLNSYAENVLPTKIKNKEINNQMLEEISANFVLNSAIKNVATEYKNVMVGQSRIDNTSLSGCLVPIDASVIKDSLLLRKDGQSFPHPANTLTTFDGKVLKQKRIIEIKGGNLRCIDGKNDTKYLSFSNQPIVVVNKIKKPFNIKLASSEIKDKTDDNETTKTVQLLDGNRSFTDEVIIIEDDINTNISDMTKNDELSSETEILPSTGAGISDGVSNTSGNSKSIALQLNTKTTKNDKIPWKMFGKNHNILDISSKKLRSHDVATKIENNGNINDTNSRLIKELDFDFDHSISQTSLSELYNGVDEIVEMHSFDNEELNSLIESGSLDNTETEDRQNTINYDHGDSSVGESNLTIGAIDTFSQNTTVKQNSTSNEIQSINKDLKPIKQVSKGLESGKDVALFDEVDDDQSTVASVTGIPILQGVISDVMSKIDSDRAAALKVVDPLNELTDEVVEISSDEEESSHVKKQFSSTLSDKRKPRRTIIIHKLNDDEIKKIKILEMNSILEEKTKNFSSEIKETSGKKPEIKNNKSQTFDLIKKPVRNVTDTESKQSLKKIEDKSIISEPIRNENAFKEAEVNKLKQTELKIAEEQLRFEKEMKIEKAKEEKRLKEKLERQIEEEKKIKEEERKKKENEERKKKEEEKRKKEEDEVRKQEEKKRKDEEERIKKEKERIKKEEEERIKKELERIKKEQEERIKKEQERIKKEEERIRKEEEERIKKEEEDRKRREEEKIKKEQEKKIEEEKKRKEDEVNSIAANIKQEKIDNVQDNFILDSIESEKITFDDEEFGNEIFQQRSNENFEDEIVQRVHKKHMKKLKLAHSIKDGIVRRKSLCSNFDVAKLPKVGSLDTSGVNVVKVQEHSSIISEDEIQEHINKEIEKERQQAHVIEIHRAQMAALKKHDESTLLQLREADLLLAMEEERKKSRLEGIRNASEMEENLGIHSKEYPAEKALMNVEKPMLEKEAEKIASKVKENSEKPTVIRILTRTRGFKNEEIMKELGYDTKNVCNENKINTSGLQNDSYGREISKSEISSKTRTRSSSSFKQVDPIPKITVGMKKSVTGSYREVPTTSSDPHKSTVSSFFEPKFRELTIPLVKLTAIPAEKVEALRQSCIRSAVNEPLSTKPVNDNEIIEKPPPKKRGRKRRIDVQNEEPNSKKLKFQNGARTNNKGRTIIPIKVTRSTADIIRQREEETLNFMAVARKLLGKRVLRLILNDINDQSMYLPSIDRHVKDLSLEEQCIVKDSVDIQAIKKKITEGTIQSIDDLQINLMLLAHNATMINKTTNIVSSDAKGFQNSVMDDVTPYRCALATEKDILPLKKNDENNTDDDDEDLNTTTVYKKLSAADRLIIEKHDHTLLNEIPEESPEDILKSIEFSSNDSCSDSDTDSLPCNKKKKNCTVLYQYF